MPRQDAEHPVTPGQPSPRTVSRRSLLQGAAGAGAAGLAVTTLGAAGLGLTATAAHADTTRQASTAPQAAASSDPIVVHVRDTRTGDIEVFSGTSQTRLRDRDLAARIAAASRQGR
jgi:nitrous oxide reductase